MEGFIMATTGKNDFKKIKDLSNIVDPEHGKTRVVTLWEYKGKKFRFTFENSNGTPCGFDYKHCVDVFNVEEDTWKHIADKKDILAFAKREIDCVSYYGNAHLFAKSVQAFMDACLEYVKVLYN